MCGYICLLEELWDATEQDSGKVNDRVLITRLSTVFQRKVKNVLEVGIKEVSQGNGTMKYFVCTSVQCPWSQEEGSVGC